MHIHVFLSICQQTRVYFIHFFVYFQDRLTRCTMHCNDKAKDLFDTGSKEPAVRSLMDRCVGSCVDDHINLIPSMTRRLKENLDSIRQWGWLWFVLTECYRVCLVTLWQTLCRFRQLNFEGFLSAVNADVKSQTACLLLTVGFVVVICIIRSTGS